MQLSEQDAWIFIMSTIRYSMGRQTYMTDLSQQLFHKYKSLLTKDQINQVYEEVEREIDLCEKFNKTLGGKIDHVLWKRFVESRFKYQDITERDCCVGGDCEECDC
jgi:hypothetical protein